MQHPFADAAYRHSSLARLEIPGSACVDGESFRFSRTSMGSSSCNHGPDLGTQVQPAGPYRRDDIMSCRFFRRLRLQR